MNFLTKRMRTSKNKTSPSMNKKVNSNGKPNPKSIKLTDKKKNSKPPKPSSKNPSKISRKSMTHSRINSSKCKKPKSCANNKPQPSPTNKKSTVF